MKVQDIPINRIKIVENHRTNIEKTHLDELMQSIQQLGLKQPIGVALSGKGKYSLRFGQRRLLACEKLGYKTISAIVVGAIDDEKLLLENLTENMQRSDPSFAELGRVIDKLSREPLSLSIKEIAVRLGKPSQKIKQIVDVYTAFPEKHRKRVVFMEKGGGRNTRKGFIPAQVATKIVSMKKHHGLTDKAIDHLVDTVAKDGMDKLDLDNVGDLIHSGMSTEKALENVRAYGVFTVDIVVKHEEVSILMDKHCLLNRKHLFKKVIYGEIPPLKKPSFVSTGITVERKKPKKVDLTKFRKMHAELIKRSKAGKLTEEQSAAIKQTGSCPSHTWTVEQCQQIQGMFEDTK